MKIGLNKKTQDLSLNNNNPHVFLIMHKNKSE